LRSVFKDQWKNWNATVAGQKKDAFIVGAVKKRDVLLKKG
jgi:hypothetical protein